MVKIQWCRAGSVGMRGALIMGLALGGAAALAQADLGKPWSRSVRGAGNCESQMRRWVVDGPIDDGRFGPRSAGQGVQMIHPMEGLTRHPPYPRCL